MADVTVVMHQSAIHELVRMHGPITAEIQRQAQPIMQRARRAAPVSPHGSHGRPRGYLRSRITMRTDEDTHGVYVDVVSTARAPGGFPYGAFQQLKRPYIIPHA